MLKLGLVPQTAWTGSIVRKMKGRHDTRLHHSLQEEVACCGPQTSSSR